MADEQSYDSRPETSAHIAQVRGLLLGAAGDLVSRGHRHDASKLHEPQRAVFDRVTARLRSLTYGSEEYKACLADMGPALDDHYAKEDHHPEHFGESEEHETDVLVEPAFHPSGDEYTVAVASCDQCDWSVRGDEDDVRGAAAAHERETFKPGGIHAMNLLQMLEMICDWIAATRRHDDGDIHRSIERNAGRFGYGEEIVQLLHNSVDALLEHEVTLPAPPRDPGIGTRRG